MSKRAGSMSPYLFIAPWVALFAVFTLGPLAGSLRLSFFRGERFIGLANFRFMRHDLLLGLALLNTIEFTVVFLLLQIPAALGLAMLVNHGKVKGKAIFRFCFFSSYLVGPVFVGVMFSRLFAERGAIDRWLGRDIPWLTSPPMILPTLLIAALWLWTGYGMVYFLAALQSVDGELYDAAQVDGAGWWGKFRHITLPGIRPMLVYIVLLGAIGGVQLFELPYVLLQGSGPGGRGLTLVMYLLISGFGTGNLGYASAIGWMMVLLLASICALQIRAMRRVI